MLDDDSIQTAFVTAKMTVGPRPKVTIPRLELLALRGAVLLSKIVRAAFQVDKQDIYYLSDSGIILCQVRRGVREGRNKLKAVVVNQVKHTISELVGLDHILYIRTDQNPTDYVSRGTTSKHLMSSSIWHRGPEFLQLQKSKWPSQEWGEIDKKNGTEIEEATTATLLTSVIVAKHTIVL